MVPEQMAERVCVVAGAGAWPFYLATAAWVGPENRRFGDVDRLGFYSGRQVQGLAPRIHRVVPSLPLTDESAASRALATDPLERRLGEALAAALHDGMSAPRVAVVLLSAPEDPDTATFEPVTHEGEAPWTMLQRLVDLGSLRAASTTADLEAR